MLICYKIYVLFVVTQQFRSFSLYSLAWNSSNCSPCFSFVFLPSFHNSILLILDSVLTSSSSHPFKLHLPLYIHFVSNTLCISYSAGCRVESGGGRGDGKWKVKQGNFSVEFILLEFYQVRRRQRELEVSEQILRNLFVIVL